MPSETISLTIPEKDLWVNLSPYEKDRVIPKSFGLTEMGRDLLAEDYMLKQITASLIYPEDETGKKFTKSGSGLLAHIFQHETDHLDGILFIDKARDVHESTSEEEYK